MYANEILSKRYGKKGIIIDNYLSKYNPEIIDILKFKAMDSKDISIILCAEKKEINKEITLQLKELNLSATVIDILKPQIVLEPQKKEIFKKIKEFCQVKKVIDYELIRVGRKYDGGYIMLNDFDKSNIAYSFGIGDDIAWDEFMAEQNIEVFCYDPFIRNLPKRNENLHFEEIGIGAEDDVKHKLLTLESILKRNKHVNQKDMILKMDVEGAEWDFLDSVSSCVLNLFKMITFELHFVPALENSQKVLRGLEKLNKTHQAIWIHANNNGRVSLGEDILIPHLLEITYVNKEQYNFIDIDYSAPINLDEPNISFKYDIELKNWGSIRN